MRRRARRAVVVAHRCHRILNDVHDGRVELGLLAAEDEVSEAGGSARAVALEQGLDLTAAPRLYYAVLDIAQREVLLRLSDMERVVKVGRVRL